MIINPRIGQRVRTQLVSSRLNDRVGIIKQIAPGFSNSLLSISVQFLDEAHHQYLFSRNELIPVDPTPEEQDQARRIAHADKYL